MASKGPQVQESVLERRLRPVYDYLDMANNKKALQECDKVLKKTPHLQCGKALRAVCLLRIGREADCVAILEALATEQVMDDATIVAMAICYRELQQYSKVCVLYERAVKADPSKEESHTQLFMSYVRVGSFKAQQQASLALYKHKQKNPYYCWAVMSVILQATRGPESSSPQRRALLLSLAERMLSKLENKFQADQEVQLYHMVLRLQDKHEEILELLDGPYGHKVSGDTQYNRLAPLRSLNRWPDVNLTCKRILCEHVDNWAVWREYLDSVFQLQGTAQAQAKPGLTNGDTGLDEDGSPDEVVDELSAVDDTAEKAHEFVCKIVEMEATNAYCLRGPYLARFELARHLQNTLTPNPHHTIGSVLGSLPDLFAEYFRRFGHRPSCVPDMRTHLPLLSVAERVQVARRCLERDSGGNGDQGGSNGWAEKEIESETQMLRHIHAHQIARLCSYHRTLLPSTLLTPSLLRHYANGNARFCLDRLSTDQGPADPYAILAAQTLADEAHALGRSKELLEALDVLVQLGEESPSNFHGKLLGMRYYQMLGGGLPAADIYETLDIKHLQLDSLGFVHCARLPTTGLLTLCGTIYDNTLKFFTTNYKDNMDHLTFLYKYGSFMKLDEFMDFRERMGHSLHYALISAERHALHLLNSVGMDTLYSFEAVYTKEVPPLYELLRDNSDYNVYQAFDPERVASLSKIEALKSQLFHSDVALLRLRHGVLSTLAAAILLVKMAADAQNDHINAVKEAIRCLEVEYEGITKEHKETLETKQDFHCVLLPFPSRLDTLLDISAIPLILSFSHFFLSVQSDDFNSCHATVAPVTSALSTISQIATSIINRENDSSDCHWTRRATLETVVNVIETLNVATLLTVLCLEIVRNKRPKKLGKIREVVLTVAASCKEALTVVDGALGAWKVRGANTADDVAAPLVEKMDAVQLLSSSEAKVVSVLERLDVSHSLSVKELRNAVRAKIKWLP